MSTASHIRSALLKFLLLCAIALGLAACASKPKPLEPSRPVTVTEVSVTAQDINDMGFALRLQEELNAKAGRATRDAGQPATLRLTVLSRSQESRFFGIPGLSGNSATIDLSLSDAATGALLRQRTLRSTGASRRGEFADTALIAQLVGDIRALLGLSGVPPYPVGGAKRDVALPSERPELIDPAYMVADPLLNGTVTPTTVDLDPEPQTLPAIDVSKPLLTPMAAAKPAVDGAARPVETEVIPQGLQLPASAPEIAPVTAGPAAADEPCVITLDNDCSDPDGN